MLGSTGAASFMSSGDAAMGQAINSPDIMALLKKGSEAECVRVIEVTQL